MAAAALLRSMARKLARAPPPHPRPHVAGGIRSCPGGSLPPPTSNQMQHGSGDRLAVGMAAAAGLRSGLPSLATKIARAPPQPHHRHILNRRLHSGSTAPPTSDKDIIIEDLRLRLWYSRAAIRISAIILSGVAIYGYFWLLPAMKKVRDRSNAIEKLLRDIISAHDEDSVALAQIIKTAAGRRMKQQCNGTTEKGTRVDKLEEEGDKGLDMLKEAAAVLDEMIADLKEYRAATDPMSQSAPSAEKEEGSRVGSETC